MLLLSSLLLLPQPRGAAKTHNIRGRALKVAQQKAPGRYEPTPPVGFGGAQRRRLGGLAGEATAAAGPEYYAWSEWFLTSWLGYALLGAWSYCLFYHLCNGIRHLFWDAGLGFSLKATYTSGVLMVIASLGLTGLSWGLGLLFYCTH